MCEKQNCNCVDGTRTTSFQIGPDPEKDIVCVETLLQKLALAETVIMDMSRYIEATEQNDGTRPDDIEAPDDWAISGVWQNLAEITHALKAGAWGHETAFLH